jgi:hypothetical protein
MLLPRYGNCLTIKNFAKILIPLVTQDQKSMMIEVIKVVDKATGIKRPDSQRAVQETEVFKETISISEIKSFRPWKKDQKQKTFLPGDWTVLYFKSNKEQKEPAKMLIAEPYDSFLERVQGIKISDERKKEINL